ncbi:MAG: hypothetical protein GY925_11055, partial [Actinomycetia bacterium]|nr:hypothetical protein [Actinomycetes bacterium]
MRLAGHLSAAPDEARRLLDRALEIHTRTGNLLGVGVVHEAYASLAWPEEPAQSLELYRQSAAW